MSRIGKKLIEIPPGVDVKIEGQKVAVRGPKGEVLREFRNEMKIEKSENQLFVLPSSANEENLSKQMKALWGTTRALLANMIKGVGEGYEKKMEIEGVGYRALVEGNTLVLHIGFTHSVKLQIPQGISCLVDKNIIAVAGVHKEAVGQFAANIRAQRIAEPYKGKGIIYVGEIIRRKLGKKAAAVGAGAKA